MPEKEQYCTVANSKLSQKKWRVMGHFGFLIVPEPGQHLLSAFPHHGV
jgi:hypothetical protein